MVNPMNLKHPEPAPAAGNRHGFTMAGKTQINRAMTMKAITCEDVQLSTIKISGFKQ